MNASEAAHRLTWQGLAIRALPVWLLIIILLAAQEHVRSVLAGTSPSWVESMLWYAFAWVPWAIVSPLMFWALLRAPLQRWSLLQHAGWVFAAGVVIVLLHTALQSLAKVLWYEFERVDAAFTYLLRAKGIVEFTLFLVMAAIVYGLRFYALAAASREREQTLLQLHRDTQLENIRKQLAPHFLLNSLNSLCALIDERQPAHQMVLALGEYLHDTVGSMDAELVPLAHEIERTRAYYRIETFRYGERIDVRIDAAPETLDCLVPNMLLHPVVENTVTHGVAESSATTSIAVDCELDECALHIRVVNRAQPGTRKAQSTTGTGVGLNLLNKTLALRYGDRARLKANAIPDGFDVHILLPVENEHAD